MPKSNAEKQNSRNHAKLTAYKVMKARIERDPDYNPTPEDTAKLAELEIEHNTNPTFGYVEDRRRFS